MSAPRRGFNPLRDIPPVIWLLATVAVAAAHTVVPVPRWLMIHLLLLGAVSHSVVVWSQHFADALLRTAPPRSWAGRVESRLWVLNTAVVLVVVGVSSDRWALTLVGAAGVIAAATAHAVLLVRQIHRSLPARFSATVRFYVAAATCLTIGAGVGAALAWNMAGPLPERLHVAHVALNVLGWVGLTVLGTLITFWPTVLGTRIDQASAAMAMRALPVLVTGVGLIALGAAVDQRWWVAVGLAAYIVGVAMVGRGLVNSIRTRPPVTYAAMSIASGVLWWFVCLMILAYSSVTAPTWQAFGTTIDRVAPLLAAGFAAQVLFGALSFLIPTALGGGPANSRVAHREFDRGAPLRIVVINAGLLVYALPVPGTVRMTVSVTVLAAFSAFLVLLTRATREWSRSRKRAESTPEFVPATAAAPWHSRPRGQRVGLAATGMSIALLSVALGVALNPAPTAASATAGALAGEVTPTGRTVEAHVTANNMRFTPNTIEVDAGDHLIITLENTDTTTVHDLVLDSGAATQRLAPGETETLDVGVVGRNADGWCSVLGHRAMGMTLSIVVKGSDATPAPEGAMDQPGMSMPGHDATTTSDVSAATLLDFHATPDPGFEPWNAALEPAGTSTVHRRTFTVKEVETEIAPGVTQTLWTYDGHAPGPVLRGHIGDTFEITLVNDGSMGHSIDFHAGSLAPDDVMRTIPPGESLIYTFTADRAGIWMYHCSTMPMSAHIANGMFGAVIIDPPDLPAVDREYIIIQSELYLGPQGGVVDFDKVQAERPDAVVFNGYVNQYDAAPLVAEVGETVRVWVLAAGPNRGTSFHVVGSQFDTVYEEGAYLLPRGTVGGGQALGLAVAQGGFVELTFPEAGHYPFVSHVMVDAERGAHGVFEVTDAP